MRSNSHDILKVRLYGPEPSNHTTDLADSEVGAERLLYIQLLPYLTMQGELWNGDCIWTTEDSLETTRCIARGDSTAALKLSVQAELLSI